MARLTSYEGMAAALGVPFCGGILRTGRYCHLEHRHQGAVADGTVHLSARPITRADTTNFLKLAARALDPSLDEDEYLWRRVYRRARAANALGRTLHFTPGRAWRNEKAFVLASVAGLSNDIPLRKQAFDWARR
jgi:hypothetical protein